MAFDVTGAKVAPSSRILDEYIYIKKKCWFLTGCQWKDKAAIVKLLFGTEIYRECKETRIISILYFRIRPLT